MVKFTSDYEFNKLDFHIIVSDSEGRKVGIRILDLLFLIVVIHVSYIYIQINIGVDKSILIFMKRKLISLGVAELRK